MKNSKLIWQGLLHALGVEIYVLIVAFIMNNAQDWFGKADEILGAMMVLTLLTVSTAIVGSLIFARPALVVYGGQKQEGIKLLLYTLMWLIIIVIADFIILASLN